MDLKIASININGFRSNYKRILVEQFVSQNKIGILLLQETHVDNVRLANQIEGTLRAEKGIWNFGTSNSCGVAILLFNSNICIENYHLDFFGRIIRLDFSYSGFENFRIVNTYFPHEPKERLEFIGNFSQYLNGAKNIILGGDFNFIFDPNLDKIGGNLQSGTIGAKPFRTILDRIGLIDCFRILYPDKRAVTWSRKNITNEKGIVKYDIVGTRLDRFYISSFIKGIVAGFQTLPCSCSDHSFVVLNLENNGNEAITFGKSYWKFNNQLLEDEIFISSFKTFWTLISRDSCVTLDWWDEMKKQIRLFCIDYCKGKNKALYGELKQLRKQFTLINLKNESNLIELDDLKEKVRVIENQLVCGSIIRSKAKILDNNENPSSYFFQKEISNSKEKTVHSITSDNVTYSNSKDILSCFESFYENLYTSEPVDSSLNDLFLQDLPQVDSSDNLLLKKKIEKHEILTALKSMEPNKSPGNDGLSSSFYLTFFDIFGDVLTYIINLAYEENSLSSSQKLSYITLICKDKSHSDNMKNYRPISLLNIDYKIISKILSTRLSNVLPKIIHVDQTCAVKGRSIFDNLHLMRNVMDYVEQKNLGVSFLCLDQEKAFDRISWSYMYSSLAAFGFDENFIKWIKLLYTDISASVIVNNFISSSFSVNRGVRQGCSLSPPLHVICFEPFAHKIRNSEDIKGLKLPGTDEQVKLSIYADDSTGIFTSDSSMHKYIYWFNLFGKISGSKINMGKSKGMYLGKWKNRSDHPFGISWIENHKILGYIFGHKFTSDDVWAKHVLKFDNTLKLWKSRKLSFKGKSTVLNSLCLSKLLYYSAANIVPDHYFTLLQRASFQFVWDSNHEPVSRKTLYLDFVNGGLNVPNLKFKCHSMYLSHLQKLINGYEAKWTYFAKYWIGLQLRYFNQSLGSNSFPHSEYVPPFYNTCLTVLQDFINISPDFVFGNATSKTFYKILLCDSSEEPRIHTICPQIDFKSIWKNMYLPCIDPAVRNTMFRLCHDVIYVNFYLYQKHITQDKNCPLCERIETVAHLFLECPVFLPLNKVILHILRQVSNNKIKFSEKTFRFFELPTLEKITKHLALIILSESRQIIWYFRNLAKHENKKVSSSQIISKFFKKIKLRILIDKKRLEVTDFIELWCVSGFCTFNLTEDKVIFNQYTDIQYFIDKRIVKVR